ncbi:MAG: hypothetical protein ISS69_02535 [Phycisphaerae bacterium]|nr:hypothetical protein [Phycisphaerae bacterium]
MNSKDNRPFNKFIRAILGLLLAWIVPGAGHAFVGRPGRGIIIFIVIGATFWSGIAIGGVMTVDHQGQKWWFAAEMLTGIHGLIGWQRESKKLQTLKHEIQVGMAVERNQREIRIREKQDEHAKCEKEIAELDRRIRAATTGEERKALEKSRKDSIDAMNEIREALIGQHSQLNSLHSAHIEKVLAEKKLALVAPTATVARVYAGVAGLLNLMCIFDVVMLALIGTVATTPPSNTKEDR